MEENTRGILRSIASLRSIADRIDRAEDTGSKRASRKDELNHNGESLRHASTYQVTQDVLGLGVDDGDLCD